jgi:transposase
MGKYTKATSHLTREEIKKKIKESKDSESVRRWLIIWNATVEPRPAEEIALHSGVALQTVHNIVSQYNRFGPEALEGPGRGSHEKRSRAYMSLSEEQEFVASFSDKGADGEIATAKTIKASFEEKVKHTIHKTTIYRVLKRHGWRKIAPRPYHVEQKENERNDFKKTFPKK